MIQNSQHPTQQNELSIPHSSDYEASRCLSYSMMAAAIDEQEEKNLSRGQFDISESPLSQNRNNQAGNKSECLPAYANEQFFQRSQNLQLKEYKNFDRLFPPNFPFNQIAIQLKDQPESEVLPSNLLLPDLLAQKKKSQDHIDVKMDLLGDSRPEKKLGENIISSVMKGTLKVQLGDIQEQSEILRQEDSGNEASHFVVPSQDSNSFNIFRQFQQQQAEAPENDHYKIRVTVHKQPVKRSTVSPSKQIQRSNHTSQAGAAMRASSNMISASGSKKLDSFSFKQLQKDQRSNSKENEGLVGGKGSGLKPFENKMFQSKIITTPESKEEQLNKEDQIKYNRSAQELKKPIVQVASRMKSTYDPKTPSTQFKNALNGGNLSEPDKHSYHKSARDSQKLLQPLQPSLTSQEKRKNNDAPLRDQIQEKLFSKIHTLQKIVDHLKEGSSNDYSVEKSKVSQIGLKPERQTITVKQEMKMSRKIETLKSMAPEQLFNGFSSIDSEKRDCSEQKQHQGNENEIINSKIQFLTSKILKLQEAISKKPVRQTSSNIIDSLQNGFEDKGIIKIKYKNYNYNSRTKLLARAKSEKKIHYSSCANTFAGDEEILDFEESIPDIAGCPLPNSSPEELAEIGLKILDAFKISSPRGGSMDMLKFKNCVQFHLSSLSLYIRWEFTGLLYLGGGECEEQFIKEGQGIEVLPKHYIFKGNFFDNKKNGAGIISYLHGIKYNGEWKNDLFEGFGKLYSKESIYKGSFHQGLKHGRGLQQFTNGDNYEGFYQDDKFHGRGKYFWKNGMSYVGDFRNGYMEGEGTWKSPKGDIYEGQYLKNMKHGYGKYRWKTGKVYEGEFRKGERVKSNKGIILPESQITDDGGDESRQAQKWESVSPTMKKFIIQRQNDEYRPKSKKKIFRF